MSQIMMDHTTEWKWGARLELKPLFNKIDLLDVTFFGGVVAVLFML